MPDSITLTWPDAIPLKGLLSTISGWDLVDILLVTVILYKIYVMLKGTRAITLGKGLLILIAITLLANWLDLHAINWLLQKIVTLIFVALPIVFQPELRRALEHLGQGSFFAKPSLLDDEEARRVVDELVSTALRLSSSKTGALLVFERKMGLNDIASTGVQIDGIVTMDFLMNVFIPNTPLHDGAGVIRGNRLVAAGCLLPLTENHNLSTELGTRHRAAIGLSEQCDALVVVVSEETGTISVAENGHIYRHLSSERLRSWLRPIFASRNEGFKELLMKWQRGAGK